MSLLSTVGAALVILSLRPVSMVDGVGFVPIEAGPPVRAPAFDPTVPVGPSPEHEAIEAPLSEPIVLAADACALEFERRCDGEACIALLVMPDLDDVFGWAQLVTSQPGFVGSVVARDLGLPPLSCADALQDVGPVHMVPDGRGELWCAGDAERCAALTGDPRFASARRLRF